MGFREIWPLGLFILLPLIILLYLLKQKHEEHTVSSLYLWNEAYKNIEAQTPWEKLKNNLLMYLQLAAMALLIISLASPFLKSGGKVYENIVLVVDNSASMNAVFQPDVTRLEEAKEKAVSFMKSLPQDTKVTIMSSNQDAEIVIGNITDRKSGEDAVRTIKATELAGDGRPAVALAESMKENYQNFQLVVFSDTAVEFKGIDGRYIEINSEGPNLSIDYVSGKEEKDSTLTVLAKVTNRGNEIMQTDVNLYIGESLADIKSINLNPLENKIIYFEQIQNPKKGNGQDIIIRAELQEDDYIIGDNSAYDIIRPETKKKALLVTEQNIFLEKAFMTKEMLEIYKSNAAEIPDDMADYDLYIYDGIFPNELPKKGNIIIINPSDSISGLFDIEEELKGVGVKAVESPVTRYLEDFSFGVNSMNGIKKPVWAESFLAAGHYSAGFYGRIGSQTIAVIAFDLHQSELPLQTEFPILIYNLLNECINNPMLSINKYKTGESVTIDVGSDISKTSVVHPSIAGDAAEESASYGNDDKITFKNTALSGLYTIKAQSVSNTERSEVFYIAYPTESESSTVVEQNSQADDTVLNGADTEDGRNDSGILQEKNQSAQSQRGSFSLQSGIIILVLLLLAVEWVVYIKQ